MSVRLEPCEWTHEDKEIVFERILRTGREAQILRTFGLYGDARDADLMYELSDCRRICGPTSAAIAHHMLRAQAATPDGPIWIDGHPIFLV